MNGGPGVPDGAIDWPIIGFANTLNSDGSGTSVGHFQVYDESLNSGSGAWVTLGTTVNYNDWNLSIDYTGSSFVYSINGVAVYTDTSPNAGTTGFTAVNMEAYNFGDPATFPSVTPANYTAYWSNTPVPEPTTMVAGALLLVPFGMSALRLLRKKQTA